jgi:hypothetical protein
MASFWSDIVDEHTGPELSDPLISAAEHALGYKLPTEYLRVMWLRNGGYPTRCCFPTVTTTSWALDHVRINALYGVGADWGIGRSPALIAERKFPNVGIVIADTPSGCDDAVMLDYSQCGPKGEPRVVYVEPGRARVSVLAPNVGAFLSALVAALPEPPASE